MMNRFGVTLMEVTIVVAVVAMLIVAISPFIRTSYQAWDVGDRKTEIIQNTRLGIDRLMTDLRQAKRLVNVAGFETGDNRISFRMDVTVEGPSGPTIEEHLRKYYYQADAVDPSFGWLRVNDSQEGDEILAGPMTPPDDGIPPLSFTYYDNSGTEIEEEDEKIDIGKVKSVDVTMRFSDEDGSLPFEIAYCVFCRKGNPSVNHPLPLVINEIVYDPPSPLKDDDYEWVEIYHAGTTGSDDIDLAQWQLGKEGKTEKISAYAGGTVLQGGDYAIVNDEDANLYTIPNPPNLYYDLIEDANPLRLIVGTKRIRLSQEGPDKVVLETPGASAEDRVMIDEVEYDETATPSWPNCVDNSLEKTDPLGESNEVSKWEEGSPYTPGDDN